MNTIYTPGSIEQPEEIDHLNKSLTYVWFGSMLVVIIAIIAGTFFSIRVLDEPPDSFPTNTAITISEGSTVRDIAEQLQEEGVVRSDVLLYFIVLFFYDETTIKASNYVFSEPLSSMQVAERLVQGDFDTDLIRFTHIEGERASQIASRASEQLPEFDGDAFVAAAEPLEGRLFPETYFIPVTFTEVELLELLTETYLAETAALQDAINDHSLTEDEILILASIIEREANTLESKKLVSSVLQNRLAIDMALQADASIEYVLDKPLSELTPADLEIDTPYNTYLYPGLPPTPIGNPGREAIEAVLYPAESDYFFYITGNDGKFYYAETYNEHLRNIETHLR